MVWTRLPWLLELVAWLEGGRGVDLFYAIQTLHQLSKGVAAASIQPKEWLER
jgi:hypothetical protein